MPDVPSRLAGRLASSQARNSARNASASGGYVKSIARFLLVDAAAGELLVGLALLGDVLGVQLLGRADAAVGLELAHDVDLTERLVHVCGAVGGRNEPAGRAHRQHLDEREPLAAQLGLERALEHLA